MSILSSLAGIGLLAILAQLAAWRLRLPAILFLLLSGILVGPVLGVLVPDELFGDLLFPVVSLSVAVILFEGSMTLKFHELREIGSTVRNLVTIGAVITWVVTSLATHYFMDLDLQLAFLFGALVVVTGPTVIVPMIRTVRPTARVANVLRWEGIVIDPLGALLAVLAYDFYIVSASENAWLAVAIAFGEIVVVGAVSGLVAGFGLGTMLRKVLIPDYLRSFMALLLVFLVYALADECVHESGLLAVTIFGMTLANMKDVEIEDILDFKETLSLLLISGLFILLAARIDPAAILAAGWGALLVLLVMMFIARPVAVMVSSLGSALTFRERLLVSWIGPRGIVCAAVAALFALRLEDRGIPEASLFVPLAFLIIIGTVVIQGLSAKYIAFWLGVRDPAPTGVLIAGGGIVARRLGAALKAADLRVVLVDTNYDNIRQARMEGLETFFGSPVSEHAERHLDLSGLGKLFAMTGRINLDGLIAMNFRSVFGVSNLYELPINAEGITDKHLVANRFRGKRLFDESCTYNRLAGLMRQGWVVKATLLTEEFDYAAYGQSLGDQAVRLFAFDGDNRLRIFTTAHTLEPQPGWRIFSLTEPREKTASHE
ncbi:MAG: sodium:proton antiporter [Pseudomonadales bacterium]|nr:sodium:proton antiporter [Pseudomonadales bacterium]